MFEASRVRPQKTISPKAKQNIAARIAAAHRFSLLRAFMRHQRDSNNRSYAIASAMQAGCSHRLLADERLTKAGLQLAVARESSWSRLPPISRAQGGHPEEICPHLCIRANDEGSAFRL